MSAGDAVIRKTANPRESYLAGMRSTIADFRRQSESWQREMDQLFEGLEHLPGPTAGPAASAVVAAPPDGWSQLIDQHLSLMEAQRNVSQELSALRQAVEQRSAPDASVWQSLREEMMEWRQATSAELAGLRQQVEKSPAISDLQPSWAAMESFCEPMMTALKHLESKLPETPFRTDLEPLTQQWATWQGHASAELAGLRGAIDQLVQPATGPTLSEVAQQLDRLREVTLAEISTLRHLQDSSPTDEVPSKLAQLLSACDQWQAASRQELTSVRELLAQHIRSSEEDKVASGAGALNLEQFQQALDERLGAFRQALEEQRPAEVELASAQRVDQLQQALDELLDAIRQVLEEQRPAEVELASAQRLDQFLQALDERLGAIRQ
ncbi:MAG: hypothetical protein AB7F89_21790, partial [Pirellulaceae bacterium]